jgi:hypothetical protein
MDKRAHPANREQSDGTAQEGADLVADQPRCHEHGDPRCLLSKHGEVVATVGTSKTGFLSLHEDGILLATTPNTGQRKPYRFEYARDGVSLRSQERGPHGRRARYALSALPLGPIVEADRRGRDIGSGVTDVDRAKIIDKMIGELSKGHSVTYAAEEVSRRVGYAPRTVLKVWRGHRRDHPRDR